MPAPRELQPHLSAAVNQAVMRGMAVESRFRPPTVAEWVRLLPGYGVNVAPQPVPTHTVGTIDLSIQEQENRLKRTSQNQIPVKLAIANVSESAQKLASSKVFLASGVAVVAAIVGFGITSILPKPQNQSPSQPQFANPTTEQTPIINTIPSTAAKETKTASPSETTSPSDTTPPSTSSRRKRNRRTSSEYSAPRSRKTQQVPEDNSSESPSTTKKRQQPTDSPSPSSAESLVEKLRAVRSSRNPSSSSNQDSTPPQPVKQPHSEVIPAAPADSKKPDPPAVVVPTSESKQNSTDNQPQKDDKSQEKPLQEQN